MENVWVVIVGLGVGSYFLRFVFLGLVGDRLMPAWLLRHLRYTAVAILPALVVPLAVWPKATGGEMDPARLAAAVMTVVVGYWTRSLLGGITAGIVTLFVLLRLLG
jgi:branched-subunit amino acid transport protein